MSVSNIYSDIPKELPDELLEEIIRSSSFRLERIISKGHSTPRGDQEGKGVKLGDE